MKVAICTPVHGSPRAGYVRCLAQLLIHMAKARPDIDLRYKIAEGHLIQNRNALAEDARSWRADYVLWIDADMVFPPTALIDLLARDRAFVAANCPTRSHPPVPTASMMKQSIYTGPYSKDIQEVDRVGLGFVLMNKLALGLLGEPAFEADPNPRYPGEDNRMCQTLIDKGLTLYIDHDLSRQVGHIAEHVYSHEIVNAFADRARAAS
jgi:glycosyltransferase involved in cell wall biosynthesis